MHGVYTPLVNLTRQEVHDELYSIGVSCFEVHALVDDLDLVPLVFDEEKKRRIIDLSCVRYARELTFFSYVRKPYHPEKEECGRLF